MILWGYRADEVILPPIWPRYSKETNSIICLDPSVKILKYREVDSNIRRPVAGALGFQLLGAACPHPDLSDTNTTLSGALYRFCPKIPGYDFPKDEFREFVRQWCADNLQPLSSSTDTSVESWLARTNYTLKRKEELLRKFRAVTDRLNPKYRNVKSFVKDEFYPDYKHARAINSRADEFKCFVGPIFQLISDELFKRPEFIKKIPIHLRPEHVISQIYRDGAVYFSTDFSSFEAHFRKVLMMDCEFVMYDYMTQFLPEHDQFMTDLNVGIAGKNRIEFKNVIMEIEAKRMSGEMNTSLGNGFSNLMFLLYICSKTAGCSNVRAQIEGDDGLCSVSGNPPTTEQFSEFGLRIKLETHADLCKASFCGMVFDIDEKKNVTDPKEVLATFGWTSSRYIRSKQSVKMTLLRCKALSLAYQYPCCPILSKLASKVLYLTRSHEVKRFVEKQGKFLYNQYDLELFLLAEKRNRQGELLFGEPGPKTRALVEELYGIPISLQVQTEKYIDDLTDIGPLDLPAIVDLCPESWKHYYLNYSAVLNPFDSNYEYPTNLWPRVAEPYYKNPDTR